MANTKINHDGDVEWRLDPKDLNLGLAGTWRVRLDHLASGIELAFDLVIAPGCRMKQEDVSFSALPYVWPVSGYEWVTFAD